MGIEPVANAAADDDDDDDDDDEHSCALGVYHCYREFFIKDRLGRQHNIMHKSVLFSIFKGFYGLSVLNLTA